MADSAIGREIGLPLLVIVLNSAVCSSWILDGGSETWTFFVFPLQDWAGRKGKGNCEWKGGLVQPD